ncbi:hypothetical protein WA026_002830 [Henosepilachna vigintioctopunctata]|uniref:Uncharacterized protein n=1 Tax=Henosepilachna vigintioctopunctata TaxID=420089 RepID=A0AAW1U0L1_9CUCU
MVSKLEYMGFRGKLRSYLTKSKQFTIVNATKSEAAEVNMGTHKVLFWDLYYTSCMYMQGSTLILPPNTYMFDYQALCQVDIVFVMSPTSMKELKSGFEWLYSNKLSVNCDKYMIHT